MGFTHLQVRTGYSFYKSTIHIERLVKKARKLNFSQLAITDENVLHGALSFYKACQRENIKPILGMTTKVKTRDHFYEPIILLAKNNKGYEQLMKLSTKINLEGKFVHVSELKTYNEHLVGILPMVTSPLADFLLDSKYIDAQKHFTFWKQYFTKDFYIGVTDHGEPKERQLLKAIKNFQKTEKLPLVAIQDVRYLKEEDYYAYDCLQAMKDGRRWMMDQVSERAKFRHLRSAKEMENLFSEQFPEALKKSEEIAGKCHVTFTFNQPIMPQYPLPKEKKADQYLRELCFQGAKRKYPKLTKPIKERLNFELEVIRKKNFSDYFLIVQDFVSYAKEEGIFVGPGRGSSASSIVAYCLDITDVDPLKHDLLFERFLNPERLSMPDIDIDFSDHRRDEVIQYVRDRFGKDQVAQIITFGTFGARSVLRDLIKTVGIDSEDERFIFQQIPSGTTKRIKDLLKESEELLMYIQQSKRLKLLFSLAHKLEGLPKHSSTHAAGIVISDRELTDYTPLTKGSKEIPLTQYAMEELEAIGLLKIDLLGLRNLSLIENIIQSIEFDTKKPFDLEGIPEDDEKTFQLLKKGQTDGIFQLESPGMKRVLKQLQPSNFNDIVAVNALYRPGPMEFIPNYIRRKHRQEKTTYPHEDLREILQPTYGVLVYQEQIMQITVRMAGLSYGSADLLRRAVATKDKMLMQEQREAFLQGAKAKGYDANVAQKVFSWIERFADYGFPKSHATAYSKISYKLAYLKANYPAYFFAELLSSIMNDRERRNQYLQEAKTLGVSPIPPSINHSFGKFTVRQGKIQVGFYAIKGVSRQAVQDILRARKEGPFHNLFDFCLRISPEEVSKTTIENLILAGAFDETYKNRASLLATLDQALDQGMLFREFSDQTSLFTEDLQLETDYEQIKDFSQLHKLATEKELMGMYMSSHPLKEYRKSLQRRNYKTFFMLQEERINQQVKSAAIIQRVKTIRTRKGESMAFITLSDETGEMEAVVFPKVYRQSHQLLKEEKMVECFGTMNLRRGEKQIIIEAIKPFSKEEFSSCEKTLFIKVTKQYHNVALKRLHEVAKQFPGNVPIILYSELENKSYKLSKRYALDPKEDCLERLQAIFGKDHVVLQK